MSMLRNVLTLGLTAAVRGVSLEREEGQTLAEYALILALIAALVIGAIVLLQGTISSIFNSTSSAI
jgi:pilus assembly protein Flp/PilA